jgi:predicted nucleotidyltransferase component of viral defense system
MLYLETISTDTLGLLRKIQSLEIFRETRLVGGTALALQYGHRKSIDLDFFGKITASDEEIEYELIQLGKLTILNKSKAIKIFSLNDVKIDIVNYQYKWLSECIIDNDIRLADPADIGAMKLSAITGRGSKKDFFDLFFLVKQYTLKELFHFYSSKFPQASEFLVLKSLIYFEDAEHDADPDMIDKSVTWSDVKKQIQKIHAEYLKTLF